ncbi:26S proteasome non-ATPase regulatory subunit 13-like [Varroa jacobsoni]|uniref:26S proteasome non-ATPase regulatory subunit 13 n=1 Tax=Varroa destructor TaxID=109461 RepID=A0A7M7K4E8_VARDE|nr:26S proteasome non-ATPase regulatory subunit 13-like [Varroa destructor]XP_022690942.1 26S proteasome non-ATPase regulatory subunit 13-like [Varroa jacobsoni]
MSTEVCAFLTKQQSSSPPDVALRWAKLEELYNKRLWHQLTVELLSFIRDPYMQNNGGLIELYANFIQDFESKLNLLSLVEIISAVVEQMVDHDECMTCLQKTKERVKPNPKAVILCNILIGKKLKDKGDLEAVKKVIEETDQQVEALGGVTEVHARFYQLTSEFYKTTADYANYYLHALRYLGCTDVEAIPLEERREKCFTLALAALLGDNIYNFGELLCHPIVASLEGTPRAWVIELLRAFNHGDLAKYNALRPQWTTQMDLQANELTLKRKMCLLCLMEMTLDKATNQRVLTFQEVATRTTLPVIEVEVLMMKALSLGLVKGTIDQVDEKITMTWVQPRVMDKAQIATMKQRLDRWCQDVAQMEMLLEDRAYDILTV